MTMMNKIRFWFLCKFRKIDTSPLQFKMWFEEMLGRQLQGGDVYYAIAVEGRPGIPTVGKDWKLYKEYTEAERKRNLLQRGNPGITLELRIVRNFYSEVK